MSHTPTPATFDEAKLRADLLEFITDSRFVLGVSVDREDYPMARTLGYLNDDFNIWLYTFNKSLKMQEFRRNGKLTLIWRETTPEWFKFLTMKGNIEIFEDAETVGRVWERYQEKYPRMRRPSGEEVDLSTRAVLRVTPIYLRAEGFGVTPPPTLKNF